MPLCRNISSTIGPLLLTVAHGAITSLTMGSLVPDAPPHHPAFPHDPADVHTADKAQSQLAEYFSGVRTIFDLPLAPQGTPFRQSVWAALQPIPYGQTRSYLDIAKAVDPTRATNLSRAIGQANGANPIGIIIPCHRVIAASGKLSGYAGGVAAKQWLLEHEQRPAQARKTQLLTLFCGL